MKKSKVVHIISSLDVGGAERVFIDICNLLNEKGHDVTALLIRQKGELFNYLSNGVKKINLDRKFKFDILAFKNLYNLLDEFDIIHVHTRYTFYFVSAVMALKKNKNYKLIFHDHYGKIEVDTKVPFFLKILNKNFFYVGVSKELYNWAINNVRIKSSKVFLLENIRVFKKNSFQNTIKTTSKEFRYVIVSNLHPIKNIEFAIDIFEKLLNKQNASLTIIGKINDINYYEYLKKIIIKKNIDNFVKFLHNENNVLSILNNFNFGLFTSKSESGPLVLIEYLSQNIPFLSYETGNVAKKIKTDNPDLIIDNFDLNKWEKRIFKIIDLNEKELNLDFIFQKHFSIDKYYNDIVNIYTKITNY